MDTSSTAFPVCMKQIELDKIGNNVGHSRLKLHSVSCYIGLLDSYLTVTMLHSSVTNSFVFLFGYTKHCISSVCVYDFFAVETNFIKCLLKNKQCCLISINYELSPNYTQP